MNMFGVIHSEVFTVGLYFLMSMVRYNIIKLQAGHLFLTKKLMGKKQGWQLTGQYAY